MDFTELRFQDPRTKSSLGSPSLVRLPGGDLPATHKIVDYHRLL